MAKGRPKFVRRFAAPPAGCLARPQDLFVFEQIERQPVHSIQSSEWTPHNPPRSAGLGSVSVDGLLPAGDPESRGLVAGPPGAKIPGQPHG